MTHLLVSVLAALQLFSAPALGAELDTKVAKALKKAELLYDVDENHDFKLVISFMGQKRSQLVFVNSGTFTAADIEVREVYSAAYRLPAEGVTTEALEKLLRQNHAVILGGWSIQGTEEDRYAVFVAKVPAKLKPDQLRHVVELVAVTADEVELELTGEDEF